MIPKLEEDIPKLQNLLSEQEKILEDINESAKGAVFLLHMLCLETSLLLCIILS